MLLLLIVGARAQALPVIPPSVGECSLLSTLLCLVSPCVICTASLDHTFGVLNAFSNSSHHSQRCT